MTGCTCPAGTSLNNTGSPISLGSPCKCSQQQVVVNGQCKTCSQAYGSGYTYTSKAGMTYQNCCDPNYSVDNSTANGCSQCPTGSSYQNYCGGTCMCDNNYGPLNQTNNCTQPLCTNGQVFNKYQCQCSCPAVEGIPEAYLNFNSDKNCCYCLSKDQTNGGSAHPLFTYDGCLIY